MTAARRSLNLCGLLLAAAIVFSPLVAAIACTGLDRAALINALGGAGPPLERSSAVAAIAAAVAVALGVPFAITVERAHAPLRRLLWALGLLTLVMPPYIVAESAIVMLGPAGKLSRWVLLSIGWGPPASDALGRARYTVPGFVYTAPGAGIALGGCFFAIVALAVVAAYRRTERRVFESARLAQGRRGVLAVGARLLLPTAAGAALLVFAAALTESVVPQLLRVPTLGEAIYERIQEGELATAAALGLTLLPLIVLAGAGGAFVLLRSRSASLAALEGESPDFDRSGGSGAGNAVGDLGACMVAAAAAAPALLLPALSLTWLTLAAALPPPTAGAHQVLRASGFFDALRGALELAQDDAVRTVLLASVTATVATVGATLLAWPLARTRWGALLGILGAALGVPAPVVGLGLIVLWNHGGIAGQIYQSPVIVVLAWLARFLPVAVLLALAALARVPPELEEAAALMGRGPVRRLAAVVLPAAAPGLVAAWLATYVLCATEFAATLLVAPPGSPLLAPSVVNLIRRGQDPEIAAVQVLLLAAVALPVALLAGGWWMRSRRGRRRT
jgi:iron(III) transport system permease protein